MDRLVLVLSSCVMAAAFRLPSSYQTSRGSKHEPSFLGGRHLAGCATPPPIPPHFGPNPLIGSQAPKLGEQRVAGIEQTSLAQFHY